jgi:hypothetical protein
MYLLLFIQLYSFSNYIGIKTRSTFFFIPELSSVLILSGLEFLNIVTICKFFELQITYKNFESLTFIIILVFNYFYFLHRKRYEKMMKKKVFKELEEFYGMIGSFSYVVLTVIFFFLVV